MIVDVRKVISGIDQEIDTIVLIPSGQLPQWVADVLAVDFTQLSRVEPGEGCLQIVVEVFAHVAGFAGLWEIVVSGGVLLKICEHSSTKELTLFWSKSDVDQIPICRKKKKREEKKLVEIPSRIKFSFLGTNHIL